GWSAGAALGSSSQPGRLRASRPPCSAFDDAYPSLSSKSICSAAYRLTSWSSGSSATSSSTRARSWYAKCGVAGPTSASTSEKVGSAIGRTLTDSTVEEVRRASVVDAMLFGTVLLWALNITVTRYMLQHGWKPLAYGTIRYFAAISLFWIFTYWRERSFWIERRDLKLVLLAALLLFLYQVCFVYALDFS